MCRSVQFLRFCVLLVSAHDVLPLLLPLALRRPSGRVTKELAAWSQAELQRDRRAHFWTRCERFAPAPDGRDLPTCHFAHGCAILMFTALEDKCCSARIDESATSERTIHSVHAAASAKMRQT